jgi:hypothetical protein
MDASDSSSGLRYHNFDTKLDNEFQRHLVMFQSIFWLARCGGAASGSDHRLWSGLADTARYVIQPTFNPHLLS